MVKIPMSFKPLINSVSGQWWENSVMSNKSVVILDMREPTLFSS